MRVVVVEDEPIARDGLCAMLAAHPSVQVVGAFGSADDARHGIRAVAPDALFVDVAMPGESGVALVASLPAESRPHVVFVTAHDSYATSAFDIEAVDYVLKPVAEHRLAQALDRVHRAIESARRADVHARLSEMLAVDAGRGDRTQVEDATPESADARLRRIAARVGDRLVSVRLADVTWIAADGDYVRVHHAGRPLLVRMTMRELERRVDPERFVRVHRSAFVNLDALVSVECLAHGEHVALLSDGARVRVGRSYRAALFAVLGEPS